MSIAAITIACISVPVSPPDIYPGAPTESGEPTVGIDHDFGSKVYYSLDSATRRGEGIEYDDVPINVSGVEYIQARASFLGKWSEPVSLTSAFFNTPDQSYEDQEYPEGEAALVPSQEAPSASRYVSAEYSPDYDHLPDGVVSGWGDSGGGRESVTIDEVNGGALGDTIVFNSISDGVIGDEKNFVGAREEDGSHDAQANRWSGNLIEVEPGKQYRIRLYGHNDSPKGNKATAQDVEVAFQIPDSTGRTVVVNGTISSSNAEPGKYWDGVVLTSEQPFHLEYVEGSALLENNAMGAAGGYQLPDSVVGEGCTVGYDLPDGQIPGCYQYAFYASVLVTVVAD